LEKFIDSCVEKPRQSYGYVYFYRPVCAKAMLKADKNDNKGNLAELMY